MFWIHGQNFVVEDCDLWSTWSVFHSTGITVPGGTPATLAAPPPIGGRFGLMRRNTIYNGGVIGSITAGSLSSRRTDVEW